jgi:hypothetical protein
VTRPVFTVTFWVDAAERAVKTAAQSVLLAGFASDAGPVNLFEFDWQAGLGFAAGGAVVSLLTSLASAPFGSPGTASLVPSPPGPEVPEEVLPNPPIVDG